MNAKPNEPAVPTKVKKVTTTKKKTKIKTKAKTLDEPEEVPLYRDTKAKIELNESIATPEYRLRSDLIKNGVKSENATKYAKKIAERGLDEDQVQFLLSRTRKKYPDLHSHK